MVLGKKAAVAALHWLCPYLTAGVLRSMLKASEVAQYVGCGTTTDTALLCPLSGRTTRKDSQRGAEIASMRY